LAGRSALASIEALVFAALLSQAAVAQETAAPAAPRNFGIVTGLAVEASGIHTRNRSNGANGAEALLRLVPSLTLAHRGGRLQGSLIYSGALSTRRGIDDREETEYLNSLTANYVLEAIEGTGFIDARATVSQQAISAVGAPVGATTSSANRTETATASVSPYLRGRLASVAEYEVRLLGAGTKGGDSAAPNSRTEQASVFLRAPRGGMLGWGLSGARQRVKFSTSTAYTTTDRVTAELTLQPDIDWRFSLTAGQERSDVIGAASQEYENYGAGVQWTPSPRTTVSLVGQERYFGRAHQFVVEHRFQRSSLRYSDSRDVTGGTDALAQGQAVTLYALLFTQFAAQIPDPIQRDQFVLSLIQALGRSRDEVVSGGLFSNAGMAAQRRRELFWTWTGPRLTVAGSAFTLDSERVDLGGVNPPGPNDNIAQSGYAGTVGWRLTPITSISASGSRAMSKDPVAIARSDLKSVSLALTSRVGARATGGVSMRYSVFNGDADSYRETAITASLSLQF
jgi:uncharacterized protein (PEP-CTERM system associated)